MFSRTRYKIASAIVTRFESLSCQPSAIFSFLMQALRWLSVVHTCSVVVCFCFVSKYLFNKPCFTDV